MENINQNILIIKTNSVGLLPPPDKKDLRTHCLHCGVFTESNNKVELEEIMNWVDTPSSHTFAKLLQKPFSGGTAKGGKQFGNACGIWQMMGADANNYTQFNQQTIVFVRIVYYRIIYPYKNGCSMGKLQGRGNYAVGGVGKICGNDAEACGKMRKLCWNYAAIC